ncbi:DUF2177 family protein [Roseateles noduli]|uniref:DUF2177 family protein n=1 Tax=Roseateles noduli TaxID=2052484 RepID=UPI003D64E475
MSLREDPIPTRAPAWRWPLAYLMTLVVFLAMDAVWLSTTSSALYQPAIGHLMAPSVDWRAVAVFYPLYIVGLVFFAVAPALAEGHPIVALWRGALFGFLAYATYDFTNQATLRDWPWHVTAIDLVWGAIVSGVASGAGAAITAATCRRAIRTSGR